MPSSQRPSRERDLLLSPQAQQPPMPDLPSDSGLTDVINAAQDILAHGTAGEPSHWSRLPWWKRPSPWWILGAVPLSAIAMSMTLAPKVTIYTSLVCQDLASSSHIGSPNDYTAVNGCASDPIVQATVARLIAAVTTCMGILSCVTTASWGLYSDRKGRTAIACVAITGILVNDAVFILVALFSHRISGGYWAFLIGPVVEGLLGGFVSSMATTNAYLADSTAPEDRSRIFSLSLGLLFTGMAFGPSIGSVLIALSGQDISVFYFATAVHAIYAIYVWFILPESLTKEQMRVSHEKYLSRDTTQGGRLARITSFLNPLSVFLPPLVTNDGNPLKRPRRDWSLTLLAIAYAFTILILGSYNYKFQYASAMFNWNSETLGYWLSIIGATRAVYLMIILPVIIKLIRVVRPAIRLGESTDPASPTHSSSFDLNLMRISLVFDLFAAIAMAFAKDPVTFTAFSIASALGSGFNPSARSVALDLYTKQGNVETGKLFGALGVVQALSSQIIGPALYGFVYMRTVATAPVAIFWVSVGILIISLIFILFVRLPEAHTAGHHRRGTEEGLTMMDVDEHCTVQDDVLIETVGEERS